MDFKTAKKIIFKHMHINDGFQNIRIEFFGGEPLLGFHRIREIIEWFHSIKWNKRHLFFINTNGTILTEEMKRWFYENRRDVILGYSFDGTKRAHNLGRDNSYNLIRKNIPFFKDNWPDQPAKMTICAETIPYVAESIIELEEMDLNFTSNVVFEDIWGNSYQKEKLLDIYSEQLAKLVDYYASHVKLFPPTPILDRHIESIYATEGRFRFCGAGHEMIAYDVDGTSYPCHRFIPWITKCPAPKKIILVNRQKVWKPKECEECKFINICPTCVGYNWQLNRDTGARTTFHCDEFKLEVLASAKLEALRLGKMDNNDFSKYSSENTAAVFKRIEAILELL
jgi:uncharacterized protein